MALIDPQVRRPPADVPAVTWAVDATHNVAAMSSKSMAKRLIVLPRFIVAMPSGPTGEEESDLSLIHI